MKEKIMVVAAHPDDEVLGCGGTIAKKTLFENSTVEVLILSKGIKSRNIFLNNIEKQIKNNIRATLKSNKLLGVKKTEILDFPDNEFDTVSLLKITKEIEKRIHKFKPNVIYTHFSGDLNIDHQITNRAVLIATRPLNKNIVNKIYGFEICSSTDWSFNTNKNFFSPHHYEDITKTIKKKILALKFYSKEMKKYPHSRSYGNLINLSKFRGATVFKNNAEAFELIRSIS